MKPNAILVHSEDNVAIVLDAVKKGEEIHIRNHDTIIAKTDIMKSHKVLLMDLNEDQEIVKYGEVIGTSAGPLKKGEWIHVHNMTISEE